LIVSLTCGKLLNRFLWFPANGIARFIVVFYFGLVGQYDRAFVHQTYCARFLKSDLNKSPDYYFDKYNTPQQRVLLYFSPWIRIVFLSPSYFQIHLMLLQRPCD